MRLSRALAFPVGLALVSLSAAPLSFAAVDEAADSAWVDDLSPISEADWSYERAAHLYERAGFGATPLEIEELASMTPAQAVSRFVEYSKIDAGELAGFDDSHIFDEGMDPFPPSRAEAVRRARDNGAALGVSVLPEGESRRLQPVVDKFFYGLRADVLENRRLALWWAQRMVSTPRPLEEKMTFFWHGHFATSDVKVRDYRMMHLQNQMLRARALGSFRDLLMGIMRDPAMLVYLDNGENIKGHPNENFGRELLELFTMGVGNYSEHDIREASRAFTGWTNDVLEFRFDAELHDDGEKTVFGKTGRLGGEDVVDLILAQAATAEFIAAKIFRFFVRDDLSPALRADLGRLFRQADYEIEPLLQTIFLSRDFYSPLSVGTQIKSPVQLVVSTYRKLGLELAPTVPDFNSLTARLGQSLLYPPNVAGWAGGRTWITPATLLDRGNVMHAVLFPPSLEEYGHPDRRMPGIYQRVGERLAQGWNITAATVVGDKASNVMADADEDFNTRYGGYRGYLMAYDRVKLVPRHRLDVDLVALVKTAGASTADEVVDHVLQRFLRVPIETAGRDALVAHLEGRLGSAELTGPPDELEEALRSVLYLVLSSPEYQLG